MLQSILGTEITLTSLLIVLGSAMILGICTAVVFSFKSNMSRSLTLSLAVIPVVVAAVIMLVNGNIGTGVAVAGAFTLVRYRSVPGSAREIASIFIAMALGLASGLGYIGVAVILFALVAILVIALTFLNLGGNTESKELRITLPENMDYNGLFDDIFRENHIDAVIKRVRLTNMGTLFEITYHISFPGETLSKSVIDAIRVRNGNLNIVYGVITEKDSYCSL
ncbi:MAG: DUF4956 domain-containing protein [Eubacterium sp.]|nr:DUF4956 domain-containing protein [Eubacterium sp.]